MNKEFVDPNFSSYSQKNLHPPPFIASKLVPPLPHPLGVWEVVGVSVCNAYSIGFDAEEIKLFGSINEFRKLRY